MKRREFGAMLSLGAGTTALGLVSCDSEKPKESIPKAETEIDEAFSKKMYKKALEITKSKVRGGDSEIYFKKPFIDAAFSNNIFLWDTCFMVCFTKYHINELPVYQALDNFYNLQEEDGYICREYRQDGRPLWSKNHPVSINPPLLAFAEWELYTVTNDLNRLKEVYPKLKNNFNYHLRYQGDDGLFWADTLGMGMDNIPRYPRGWDNDGVGMTHHELGDLVGKMSGPSEDRLDYFISEYVKTLQGIWNEQGRLVDFSAQMAMFAIQLKKMAELTGNDSDISYFNDFHTELKNRINELCWSEDDKFYYDLGYGEQIQRKHIGMYWMLLGKLVPEERLDEFVAHLTNPDEFFRKMPLPALSADDPDYKGWGDYWLGGVWAPTSYMVLKGLTENGRHDLAKRLASITYKNVAEVFKATGTFWENYAPDLISYGMPAKKDFCGWTGLIPIAVYHEYIK